MTRHKMALGELFDIGSSKRVLQSQWRSEGIPFYRGREITKLTLNGFVDNELFISEEQYSEYADKYGVPKCDDIMITAIGTIGNSYIVKEGERFYFKDASVLWLKKVSDVSSDFINLWLKSPKFFEQLDKGNGATVDTLTIQKLKSVIVDLPPLPEQQRIVGILDEAFDGIATARANAEKNLQNARALFESHLQAVFSQQGEGWVQRTLSEVSKDFGRGKSKHRPRNDPKLYEGKYPFIQTGDVRNSEHLITSYSQTYNEIGLAQSKLWPKGTLCITIAANIAETGILDFDSCFPDSVIGVVVNEKMTSNKFLEYLLQSFKAELQAQGKGSAQDNINLGTFENKMIPFPDLKTQQAIVTTLDSLREDTLSLESLYQQKLIAFDELKLSMLDQAFKGVL